MVQRVRRKIIGIVSVKKPEFDDFKSGKTLWYLIPRVNTQWMNVVLETFATEAGANQDLIILLVQDRAGWHRSQKVNLPTGIETEFLPAYSPEL